MLKNCLVTAYRNLLRNKGYAFLNVAGLAIGTASCILIFLVIDFEISFDSFHKKKNQIYRVVTENHNPEGITYSSGAPQPVAAALRIDYPQLKEVAAIFGGQSELVTIPENGLNVAKKFKEKRGVYYAESQFFEMFNFGWLAGDRKTALTDPYTAVLTKETAERYFGNWKAAIGKTIKHDNAALLKVTGVLDDVPLNSDFPFKVVISYPTLKIANEDWVTTHSEAYCFVVLPPDLSPSVFNNFLDAFVKKHKPADHIKDKLILQPLANIHFDERFGTFSGRTFSKELINALRLIGAFLLVIACVNFINLATAQAVNRAKEVGVRKVLGSSRIQLVTQFIGETALVTFSAIIVATGIAALTLPFLSHLLEVPLGSAISVSRTILFLILLLLTVTVVAGFYPAAVISTFSPITALKSKMALKIPGGISLRKTLVALQFCIAQVLIIGTLVVVNQVSYFQNTSPGFDKEAILTVPTPADSLSRVKYNYLRDQLMQQPGIKSLTFSFGSPVNDIVNWTSDFNFDHRIKNTDFSANLKWADTGYFKTYNLQFIAGRPYYNSDTVREFVINETLVKRLGIRNSQEALGKELSFWGGKIVAPIVGVVKDFHVSSFRDPVSPVVLGSWKDFYWSVGIKIEPGKTKETLANIENLWTKTFPDHLYEHQFLDEKIANFYKQENQLSQLYRIFASIAIFISCLGLYGLVSFMTLQKNKEVGIRKVLGASVSSIVYLFSKEFIILIGIAFLIAAPVAYYFMHKWLSNFTYRVDLTWYLFVSAFLASIVIAWMSVGYRAVKAAIANPVKSLRSE